MSKAAMARAPERTTPEAKMPAKSPFELMRVLSNEMDRVFSDFGFARHWPFAPRTSGLEEALWSPDIEIDERGGKLAIRADLPGLTKDDVTIDVTEDMLTITGERRRAQEYEGEGHYRSERSYGRFSRSIALPEGAKPDTAKASFTNGVLEITIDVPAQPKPAARHIEIEDKPGATPAA